MSSFIQQIASLFPAPMDVSKYFRKSEINVLMPFYHSVSDRPLKHLIHLYKLRSVKEFEADLDYLLAKFRALSLKDYISGDRGIADGKPPMVLSFDDGLIQCYDEIMPILLRKGVPATFFLNNAFIDNQGLFFRFKVSLLIERWSLTSEQQRNKASEILDCSVKEIRKRLLAVSYVEREMTDQVAEAWGLSFEDYLKEEPVYLSSMHIRKMMEHGFEFGSHGIDHPMFSLLKKEVAMDHITASMQELKNKYQLAHKYFAFPFTDHGVQDDTIDALFRKEIIDVGFGTAGLKLDQWEHYYQRIPMELLGKDAKKTINGEINRSILRRLKGKNIVKRT